MRTPKPKNQQAKGPFGRKQSKRQEENLALVEAIKRNDPNALYQLVWENRGLVARAMKKSGIPASEREDFLQDALLYLIEEGTAAKYDPAKSNVSTYFTRAFEYAAARYRHRRMDKLFAKNARVSLDAIDRAPRYHHPVVQDAQIVRIVESGIREWGYRNRHRNKDNAGYILREHVLLGKNYTDIARELDISVSTVRDWGNRGIIFLREYLQKMGIKPGGVK